MSNKQTAKNWCHRCEGAGKATGCNPDRPGVRCNSECECADIACRLCRGLGYKGCIDCGAEVPAGQAYHWDDADGFWFCAECSAAREAAETRSDKIALDALDAKYWSFDECLRREKAQERA